MLSNLSKHCGVAYRTQIFFSQGSQLSSPNRITFLKALLYGAVLDSFPAPNKTIVCVPNAFAKWPGPESVVSNACADANNSDNCNKDVAPAMFSMPDESC